jgi:DNA-binding MarR family transcriptional regulator
MSYANDMTDQSPDADDADEPGDPAALAAELRVSLMRAVRRIRAEKADLDLSDGQLAVLAVLHRSGPLTNRELADFEHVQPPSMTRTVACLEERGLVARTSHPADGRQILVAATEAGRATAQDTRRRREAWLARRLEQLDPAERDLLARAGLILSRIADS